MKPRGPNYQKERGERQERRILAALAVRPMTTSELQEKLSLSRPSIGNYIRRLMAAPRQVRISGYAPRPEQGGKRAAYFAIGAGRDAKRPAHLTRAEQFKLLKADQERHDIHLAKRRNAVLIKRITAAPHPWFAALGVPA